MTSLIRQVPPIGDYPDPRHEGYPECGTVRGYMAHLHYDDTPCTACLQAWQSFQTTPLPYTATRRRKATPMTDPQRFELRITGEVEVVPGPLSLIRAIAVEALQNADMPNDVHTRCAAILNAIDAEIAA